MSDITRYHVPDNQLDVIGQLDRDHRFPGSWLLLHCEDGHWQVTTDGSAPDIQAEIAAQFPLWDSTLHGQPSILDYERDWYDC